MNVNVELVADQLVHMARPGGVVLVDSQFFAPLVEALRTRAQHLHLSVRTAHFEDPVSLLQQVLVTPKPEIACCPDGATEEQCECIRKAHMLLEQLGIPIIETHAELALFANVNPDPHRVEASSLPPASVAA
jgi:hypothetical protein